jgi:hypothetical protein
MTTGIAVDRLDGGAVQVLQLDGARSAARPCVSRTATTTTS